MEAKFETELGVRRMALRKIFKAHSLAEKFGGPRGIWLGGTGLLAFTTMFLSAACGVLGIAVFALPLFVIAVGMVGMRGTSHRAFWDKLFELLEGYEPRAQWEYQHLQEVVKENRWDEFNAAFRQWHASERVFTLPAPPQANSGAAHRFASKAISREPTVIEPDEKWKAHAYPLQQVSIFLQGTRHSDRASLVDLLQTVVARLHAGDMAGTEHDDDFGYSFKVDLASKGPSFFDGPCGSA
ncbi:MULTISPECIES: hypothetical protein [Cupriavidus]|jgi:hypothetical protein|uniref:hypothetical protein n=1 Tax=Cupriavidus TaxID=106589 RepID=UPI0004645B30|nr:hypothetical protein [Cupriavidus metallidurans]KWW32388.1 hypothetical protein AU374_05988 [Cupriavidus metallidurans]